ncbi:hypothetical protein SAY87_020960 [Trapa incisa]|uniref:Pentatricopeptide repeat-containing protein n=1 Tax=Trapa incisa TaxID=236973 RepID=A0AAN7PNQ7_9MYRT|nr:hypothetical protein SAY87_020960 [Trapa incisa]
MHFNHLRLGSSLSSKSLHVFKLSRAIGCSRRFLPLSTAAVTLKTDPHQPEKRPCLIDFEPLFHSCTQASHVKCLHAILVVSGRFTSNFASTRLLNLYAHHGDACSSLSVFDQIKAKDSYTWNSMVSAYVRNGYLNEATKIFRQFVLTSGLRPDVYTFPPSNMD